MKNLRLLIIILILIAIVAGGIYLYKWVNDPSVAIVGTWRNTKSGSVLNFYEDGTFSETGGQMPVSGNITFINPTTFKANYYGIGAIMGPVIMNIQLTDNHLMITSPYNTREEYNKIPDSSLDDWLRNIFNNTDLRTIKI
jgi:hypothetical protein